MMGEKAKYLLGLIVIAMFFYAKGIKIEYYLLLPY